ncbi:hypothetical protein DEI93_13695 [Curtobacterium sp. MCBD17_035]|uniref:hypothetical protein n=1 Tax=Curtobacterium sp. MCBD17_035 TaxID=2175673 RepID=UPI0021ACF31B|nr:hypothetical protein [Curtobacterium sp. MCBD17_035]WIB66998.1 hypothetical protein DEI93_13695 [Curtobacterium sp. MCBD17_035]
MPALPTPVSTAVHGVGGASRPRRLARLLRIRRLARLIRIALEGRHSGWTAPLLLWVGSRAVSTVLLVGVLLVGAAAGHEPEGHGGAHGLLAFSGSWDAWWYQTVAVHGYPRSVPLDHHGHVEPNAWAFLPVFPAVVRVVMAVTGLSFWGAGVVVSLFSGAGGTVVLYRLVRAVAGSRRARRATALFVFGPLGFLLQVPYAEALSLLLVAGALLALVQRRYPLVAALGVVAAFTRPGALALSVAVAVHLVAIEVRAGRSRTRGLPARRWIHRVPWTTRLGLAATGIVVAVAGLAWPFIASAVTGRPDTYLDSELAWWTGYVGHVHFVPMTPWFMLAGRWLGNGGFVLVIAVIAAAVWLLVRRSTRALGPEVVGFVAAYGVYLVAVFLPQQSLVRLLMPAAPVLGTDLFVRTRRRTVVLAVVGVVLQAIAIVLIWYIGFP